ncbi:hypothetical protein Bbelb_437280 [Branchiostoma belcheri]|nr:hypothetical protein Bbelb_437280 [Branchiostoma belcheri]
MFPNIRRVYILYKCLHVILIMVEYNQELLQCHSIPLKDLVEPYLTVQGTVNANLVGGCGRNHLVVVQTQSMCWLTVAWGTTVQLRISPSCARHILMMVPVLMSRADTTPEEKPTATHVPDGLTHRHRIRPTVDNNHKKQKQMMLPVGEPPPCPHGTHSSCAVCTSTDTPSCCSHHHGYGWTTT